MIDLLDVFAEHCAPLDVALIPTQLSPGLVRELCRRAVQEPGLLGLHQHGYAHVNHEPEGRKCEFGPSRPAAAQRRDLEEGRRRLDDLVGPFLAPIFTPPWNRCTEATAHLLVELGFAALSRESGAPLYAIDGLGELPIHVDWHKRRRGVRLDRAAIGELLASRTRTTGRAGVMFHHEAMDSGDRRAVAELLELVTRHDHARCHPMSGLPTDHGVFS